MSSPHSVYRHFADFLECGAPHTFWRLGRQERLPDRVRLFFDRLALGQHHVSVGLRATTPGEYALPPAHAEAMYMPEVYGRSEAERITSAAPGATTAATAIP